MRVQMSHLHESTHMHECAVRKGVILLEVNSLNTLYMNLMAKGLLTHHIFLFLFNLLSHKLENTRDRDGKVLTNFSPYSIIIH